MHRRAYAKLNLALSVGPLDPGRRLHPIASWMHAIDLSDEVEVEARLGHGRGASRRPTSESEVLIEWADDAPRPSEIDWGPEEDLGVRALRVLEGHAGEPLPVRLRMKKRIPVGGGLGGGSADAAAVLLAVNDLFALGITPAHLLRLSRAVGSDVAFFLDEENPPRPALVTGFGDRIERVARAGADIILILPPFGCPTAEVYRAFDRGTIPGLREQEVAELARREAVSGADLFNDLAAAAEQVHPELLKLRARLVAAVGDEVHITGSGSTLFVVPTDADAATEALEIAAPEAAVVRTRLI